MPESHTSPPARVTAALLCLFLGLSSPSSADTIQSSRIEQTVSYLSSLGSRVAGYPGSDLAAAFIERQFQEIGLEQVRREPFEIVVPIDHGARLELTERSERFELHGLWPNGVRTPTISPPGYSGTLIYGGTGTWPELSGHELEDRVVLLEFNSAQRWLDMASLGARAIIFIEPEATSTQQALEKYADAPLDVPRFWINRRDGIDLRQRLAETELSVSLHSRMDWQHRTTWNVLGTIPGADPELGAETIALQAYYDGTSVAPALAPSAETSASIVALLELARYLQRERPARTIIFVATSAHFQAQQGIVEFLRRHSRVHDAYAEHLPEPLDIDLFIGLDLSTGTDQLGLWNNTTQSKLTRFFSPFSRVFMAHGEVAAQELGRDPTSALVNGVSPVRGLTWSSYMPLSLRTDGQIVLDSGLPALTFATVNDARLVLDTPLDDGTHLQLPNLTRQIELLYTVVSRTLAEPELLAPAADLRQAIHDQLRDVRIHTRRFQRRSQTPDRPVANALVTMRESHFTINGVKPTRLYMTDSSGDVEVPALTLGTWETAAYVVDPASGAIASATDLKGGETSLTRGPTSRYGYLHLDVRFSKTGDHTIVLFPAVAQEIYSLVHPAPLSGQGLRIVDASGAEPRQYGYNLTYGMDSPAAVLFGPAVPEEQDRFKLLLKDMPIVNSSGTGSAEEALGRGYLPTDGPLTNTTYNAALDAWRIDEHRLETMRQHAIDSAPLQRLHDEAQEHIEAASQAREALDWDLYVALARAALGIESRAYPRIVATLNDVIKGLLFFLALLIPAAFFGERLLFASSDIRRQLTGFGALMLIMWTVLSLVHPAFDLAHPLVILLGFSIMMMALFVGFMVATRFNRHTAEYKSLVARVHTADFSRMSALYVAFMLGVSNMRRRKLPTGLTLATLTLLTFSMLSFTSIQDRLRFISVPLQIEAARQGILLRQPNWKPLEPSMLEHVSSHFGRDGTISARSWYRTAGGQAGESIAVSSAERHTNAVDMVGLMPEEDAVTRLSSTLGSGSFFERADERSCLLSDKMASALGIAATDVGHATLQVMGSELLVRGIFHSPSVDQLLDLDGAAIMPVDLRLSSFAEAETESDELEEGVVDAREVRAFVHHSAADVLILPYEVLRGFGGAIRSIGIRFDDGAPGRLLIEEFLSRVDTGLYASLPAPGRTHAGVHHYRSIGLGSVEGLGALAVPIAIASLIILNAMLGAVYERSREIGIYSSVGLAPLHIAFLFIAEACVYAVLGVTLGYVLGQTLGKILLAFDLLHGIELNYSSSSGVASALLVMAVVLLSTLYPARVAALAAVPETVRRWRPPPPDGDEWRFTFPFNVSGAQIQGSCGFLYSYFASFAGAASGSIYTEDVRLSASGDAATAPVSEYLLDFTQWLSPYDLGVSQAVRIEFSETPAPGMYSIDIVIDRISGESFHWRRLNSRFFSMLRKQLLIWNTLDLQTRLDHAATAATVLQTRQAAPAMPRETEHPVSSRQEAETRTSPFSVRGILLGAALCLLIGAGTTYTTYVLQGSWGGSNASSPAAVFLFFIVTAVLNVILGLIRHRFVLSRADLVLIYVMMLMAVTVPNQAFVGYVIPAISGVYYYASEQNEFASLFFEHIPKWMVPQDRDAITSMYEGLPPGSAIPWDTWVGPLFYWFLLFAAISSLMVCLSVILHRQWSVHERLEYPMAQVPLQMIERSPHGPMAQIGPLYRNKWTWIGFAIPAVILSLKGLSFHFPSVPMINLTYFGSLPFFGMQLGLGVTWAWIGFSYLVNLDISLSIWLFYLISKLQDNAFVTFGIAPTEKLSSMSQGATADLSHQGMGACVVFVLFALWVARRHLADVLRKAWRPQEGIDDSEELISYRTAVIGFVVSLVVMGVWLWQSGIPLWIVPLFLGICLVFYIMITRVIATAGIATARSPMITAFVLISGLGSSTIGAAGLTAFAFTYVWQAEMRLFPMIACANGLKLAETVRGPKKRLLWAIVIAMGASLVGATWVYMDSSYTHGTVNLFFIYTSMAQSPFHDLSRAMTNLTGPDWRGWGFTGLGAAIEALLIYAQHHFSWWRIHPLGFIIGSGWLASAIWFSVFLAWFSKLTIMKYGGMSRFLAAKPFFIGLILGEATTAGIWLILDTLLGGVGNNLSRM